MPLSVSERIVVGGGGVRVVAVVAVAAVGECHCGQQKGSDEGHGGVNFIVVLEGSSRVCLQVWYKIQDGVVDAERELNAGNSLVRERERDRETPTAQRRQRDGLDEGLARRGR